MSQIPTILVDQFGYRPGDSKVAVIVQSQAGTTVDGRLSDSYQVINKATNQTIYQAAAQIWQSGAIHSQSGDRAAWFDFSSITQPGNYIIRNSRTGEISDTFEIADDVYKDVLVAATRTFFYQRSGFAKQTPYADSRWTDGAAFLGPGQDTEARFVNDKTNASLARDMRGGWFDAGDTNKYVTFATTAVHQLLDAYKQNSAIWTDDFNLPESGNGIPDLIDELQFELDWLKRMQDSDGGAFIKLGTLDYNWATKPSLDTRPRFYGPKSSSSTIALSSMFAHAALVFQKLPAKAGEANTLLQKAQLAWNWFRANPINLNSDTGEIKAGDADVYADGQIGMAVTAAVYLFALTGQTTYQDYIRDNYTKTYPLKGFAWSVYEPYIGDALLFYTTLNNADATLKQTILSRFNQQLQQRTVIYGDGTTLDPYRAYMPNDQYHWGSNSVKSNIGSTNYDAILYNQAANNAKVYQDRALGSLNYIHGVNPLGKVYLSNMYDYGAERSIHEIYHEWFGQGVYDNALTSPNGPPPGYLVGGPNKNYTGSAPIKGLPPMKAYIDNNDGAIRAWEISEPAIYYQSSYIKLLSKFVTAGASGQTFTGTAGNDSLSGTSQDDRLEGLAGQDTLQGNGGNDVIVAGSGNDLLRGGTGNDTLEGGTGNDTLNGGPGNDSLNGGDGIDTASYGGATAAVNVNLSTGLATGGDGNDALTSIERVTGSAYADTLTGSSTSDTLSGGGGNDSLNGGGGNDSLNGGSGNDSLNGGSGNDTLNGQDGNDFMLAGAGSDRLNGGGGNDTLNGGGGKDTLTGGSGSDWFVYAVLADQGDVIQDFAANQDKIVMTALFTALGYGGSNPIADSYLRFLAAGSATQIQIDANGVSGGANFITLTTLNATTPSSLTLGANVIV